MDHDMCVRARVQCALWQANESCVEEVIKNLRPGMNLQFIGEFVECVVGHALVFTLVCALRGQL